MERCILPSKVPESLPKERAGSVDTSAGNAGARPADSKAALPASDIPDVTMQQLINAGLNAFGLQLFAESVAGAAGSHTFRPFTFRFRNIRITLAPDGEVDTSHH
jgi:hypothetical protein